jgi:hypothetical protein
MKDLEAVSERITTLWCVTMCFMTINERNFRAMYCLNSELRFIETKDIRASETSVKLYHSIRSQIKKYSDDVYTKFAILFVVNF